MPIVFSVCSLLCDLLLARYAFSMGCSGHQSPGLFTHPADKSVHHNKLSYWTDTAKLLEKGK